MKMLIGGAVGTIFGVITLGLWWREFFHLLAGCIPLMLIIGGCLAIYLGFDEFKDSYEE